MEITIDEIGRKVKPLLVRFEQELGYTGTKPADDREAVIKGMHQQAALLGVPYPEGSVAWHAFQSSVNYAIFCYPNLPLEAQIYAGIFTWITIIIDDQITVDVEEWQQFVPRCLAGAKQHNVVAQACDRWLQMSRHYYSPLVANFLVTSVFDFVNANIIEWIEAPKIVHTAGGQSWPWYLREKAGLADAFAFLTFPKTTCPAVQCYLEAIPDMNKFLCLTNDIFSFYKEECAHETDNYLRHRASFEGADIYDVMEKVADEVLDIHHRISLALEGKELYAQLWHEHVMGYLAFHKNSQRYKLQDLGLGAVHA